MDAREQPQIYLISPPEIELSSFGPKLAQVLDTHAVACVRLALATRDEDRLSRAADSLREITHARDVALVISDHVVLAKRLGLDGVHLSDAARSVRPARKALGPDAIVGAYCGGSKHDGLSAGEAGSDYVSFGPIAASALGDGSYAEADIFAWWSEMIEIPVVAEGGLDVSGIAALAPHVDFFGIGEEIWSHDAPVQALGALMQAMSIPA